MGPTRPAPTAHVAGDTSPHDKRAGSRGREAFLQPFGASAWCLTFSLAGESGRQSRDPSFPTGPGDPSLPCSSWGTRLWGRYPPPWAAPGGHRREARLQSNPSGAACITPHPAQAPTSDEHCVHGVGGIRLESTQTKGRALQCKRSGFNLREPLHTQSPEHPGPGGHAPAQLGGNATEAGAAWPGEPSARACV